MKHYYFITVTAKPVWELLGAAVLEADNEAGALVKMAQLGIDLGEGTEVSCIQLNYPNKPPPGELCHKILNFSEYVHFNGWMSLQQPVDPALRRHYVMMARSDLIDGLVAGGLIHGANPEEALERFWGFGVDPVEFSVVYTAITEAGSPIVLGEQAFPEGVLRLLQAWTRLATGFEEKSSYTSYRARIMAEKEQAIH